MSEGREREAALVEAEFRAVWKGTGVLKVEEL